MGFSRWLFRWWMMVLHWPILRRICLEMVLDVRVCLVMEVGW